MADDAQVDDVEWSCGPENNTQREENATVHAGMLWLKMRNFPQLFGSFNVVVFGQNEPEMAANHPHSASPPSTKALIHLNDYTLIAGDCCAVQLNGSESLGVARIVDIVSTRQREALVLVQWYCAAEGEGEGEGEDELLFCRRGGAAARGAPRARGGLAGAVAGEQRDAGAAQTPPPSAAVDGRELEAQLSGVGVPRLPPLLRARVLVALVGAAYWAAARAEARMAAQTELLRAKGKSKSKKGKGKSKGKGRRSKLSDEDSEELAILPSMPPHKRRRVDGLEAEAAALRRSLIAAEAQLAQRAAKEERLRQDALEWRRKCDFMHDDHRTKAATQRDEYAKVHEALQQENRKLKDKLKEWKRKLKLKNEKLALFRKARDKDRHKDRHAQLVHTLETVTYRISSLPVDPRAPPPPPALDRGDQ